MANPAKPINVFSDALKIFLNSVDTVINWAPKRLSAAIATQSLPTMATTEPPLYCIIDYFESLVLFLFTESVFPFFYHVDKSIILREGDRRRKQSSTLTRNCPAIRAHVAQMKITSPTVIVAPTVAVLMRQAKPLRGENDGSF